MQETHNGRTQWITVPSFWQGTEAECNEAINEQLTTTPPSLLFEQDAIRRPELANRKICIKGTLVWKIFSSTWYSSATVFYWQKYPQTGLKNGMAILICNAVICWVMIHQLFHWHKSVVKSFLIVCLFTVPVGRPEQNLMQCSAGKGGRSKARKATGQSFPSFWAWSTDMGEVVTLCQAWHQYLALPIIPRLQCHHGRSHHRYLTWISQNASGIKSHIFRSCSLPWTV